MEKLVIAGREFNSRLFLGTGKFNSNEIMEQSILASGTEMVTVAMKRIELENKEDDMLKHIRHPHIQLLPNTSGVRNAEEAVFAAQMAREAFGTNWLKLEIHPDPRYLLPDSVETLKATEELVKLGFVVLSMSTRFMATVTISVPDASIDCSIHSFELNLPVPRKRRELNSRPAMINFSISDLVLSSFHHRVTRSLTEF